MFTKKLIKTKTDVNFQNKNGYIGLKERESEQTNLEYIFI